MLQVMRKHAKWFYILFFIVILTFMFWGVGTVDQSTSVSVATIEKEQITIDEYWRAYERMQGLYKDTYKEKFDADMEKKLNLKQKVLDTLVDERVLYSAAQKVGIKVSDAELEKEIMRDPSFQQDGVFNKQIYLRTLELNRFSTKYYEEMKRRELMVTRMLQIIDESIDLSPAERNTIAGNEAAKSQLLGLMVQDKRGKAVKSYIDALKKQMKLQINNDLIL